MGVRCTRGERCRGTARTSPGRSLRGALRLAAVAVSLRPALTPPNPSPCAEFSKIAQATSVGFAIMGFIGFFVKLIFIPINNIIVGMS